MDVIVEVSNTGLGSDSSDLGAMQVFVDALDAGTEAVEKTASINTTASLGVSMSAGVVGLCYKWIYQPWRWICLEERCL